MGPSCHGQLCLSLAGLRDQQAPNFRSLSLVCQLLLIQVRTIPKLQNSNFWRTVFCRLWSCNFIIFKLKREKYLGLPEASLCSAVQHTDLTWFAQGLHLPNPSWKGRTEGDRRLSAVNLGGSGVAGAAFPPRAKLQQRGRRLSQCPRRRLRETRPRSRSADSGSTSSGSTSVSAAPGFLEGCFRRSLWSLSSCSAHTHTALREARQRGRSAAPHDDAKHRKRPSGPPPGPRSRKLGVCCRSAALGGLAAPCSGIPAASSGPP